MPVIGILLAMFSCYGTTLLLTVLAAFGITVPLNGTLWSVLIVAFSALGVSGLVSGYRLHGTNAPLIVAVIGLGLLGWVMFGTYSRLEELVAFALLVAGAVWDRRARRHSFGGRCETPIAVTTVSQFPPRTES